MSLQITPCQPADLEAVAAIYNEHIRLGVSNMVESEKTATDIQSWLNNFNARERLFVCRKSDLIVGWAIIKKYSDREGYRFACETAVYLSSSETGKGYGGLIKQFLIDTCKALEYKHLVAKIFSNNKASIRYNEKLGYEMVGVQKNIGFKNGEWIDMTIMQYLID